MSPGSGTAITKSGDAQNEVEIFNQTPKGVVQAVTIPSLVSTCFSSFERMLASIIEKEPKLSHEITSSEVSDTIGRFRVWSSNIGAHKTGRSSLEYRLRDASHIRERAQALLQSLIDFIKDGIAIVKGEKTAWDKLPPDTHSDPNPTDSESSDSSSDGSMDNETELHQVMISINARITLLMRLSMAIRMPASHDRLLNSANIDISHFVEWDIRHVREMFPDAEEDIARRLGAAISRRRRDLKYRSNHSRNLAHEPMSKDDERTEYQPQSTIASSPPEAIKNTSHLVGLEAEENSDTAVSQTSFATSGRFY